MSAAARRAAEAEQLLAAVGIDARVTAAGLQGEVAAVRAPVERLADVAGQAAALRALGFGYVALDIGPDGPGQPGRD
ncbi:MAG TPA: hypothetical protein VMN78_11145 [Longimicrobiales bacterium]|nr:hypothetical protein [Longimicrobiales bacterium]